MYTQSQKSHVRGAAAQGSNQSVYTPYGHSSTMNPKRQPNMSIAQNVSSNYTPYGTTDRRYTHQAPSNGADANNRNTGGRNTLQSNASLIMKQNGTSSSSNIGRTGVSAAHATPTHVSNKAASINDN